MPEPKTPGPWIVGHPGGPAGPFWSLVNAEGNVVAPQIVEEADARAVADLHALRESLRRTESHLSLLRLYEDAIDRNGTLSGDDVRGLIAAVRTLEAERVRLRREGARVLDAVTALVEAMGAEHRKMATAPPGCHFPTPDRPL